MGAQRTWTERSIVKWTLINTDKITFYKLRELFICQVNQAISGRITTNSSVCICVYLPPAMAASLSSCPLNR